MIVDQVYLGGHQKNISAEPLARLLPCGNRGGIRFKRGTVRPYALAVLYTSGWDADWPDALDIQSGTLTYYGDNKRPGRDLHDTVRRGNRLLRFAFEETHKAPGPDPVIPPFFLFERHGTGWDVVFRGLAVPGGPGSNQDDLVAVWRSSGGSRFQNYRATLTILDVPRIPRQWILSLVGDDPLGPGCPIAWREWALKRRYIALTAQPTHRVRTRLEQLPTSVGERDVLATLYEHFSHRPYAFEECANEVWKMLAFPHVTYSKLTRAVVDGGKDADGIYSLGPPDDHIPLTFALEAKCYAATNAVGVKELARLISRLKHRQFGVLVTTSFLGDQAYRELRDDEHPVVVLCGVDLVRILKQNGFGDAVAVKQWLSLTFPDLGPNPRRTPSTNI